MTNADSPLAGLRSEPVLVSVVIPTKHRAPLLARAVRSVLSQTMRAFEVVVVVDGVDPETSVALSRITDARLRVVQLDESVGGAEARNVGVRRARGTWVAFLDDDDEWLPDKLALQLKAVEGADLRAPLVSCKVIARAPGGDDVWPTRTPSTGEKLGDYLFARRSVFQGESLLQTSTILVARELMLAVPFTSGLRKHQDWDWSLRASTYPGFGIVFVSVPLVVYYIDEPRPSVSAAQTWRFSFDWVQQYRALMSDRAYSGFLSAQVAPQAAKARDWRAFWILLGGLVRSTPFDIRLLALFLAMWIVPQPVRRRLRVLRAGARHPVIRLANEQIGP